MFCLNSENLFFFFFHQHLASIAGRACGWFGPEADRLVTATAAVVRGDS